MEQVLERPDAEGGDDFVVSVDNESRFVFEAMQPLRPIPLGTPTRRARAFGGPVPVLRRLAGGLAARGHQVVVYTTALTSARGPRTRR